MLDPASLDLAAGLSPAWRSDLAPGDRLAVDLHGWTELRVARIVRQQAVCECGRRVRLRDGYVLDSASLHARRMTPELEQAIARTGELAWIEQCARQELRELPAHELAQVRALLAQLRAGRG